MESVCVVWGRGGAPRLSGAVLSHHGLVSSLLCALEMISLNNPELLPEMLGQGARSRVPQEKWEAEGRALICRTTCL